MPELCCFTFSCQCVKDTVPYFCQAFGCLWPFLMEPHFNYWWRFDNNIKDLGDNIRKLEETTTHIEQQIEGARLRTENLRTGVEEWVKLSTKKLEEARRILPCNNIPEARNLISRYSMGKIVKKTAEEIATLIDDGNFVCISDPAPPPSMGSTSYGHIMDFGSRKPIEDDIIASLIDNSVSIIGICGMKGVGKTTMVQKISKRVKDENLFDEIVMIVVSQQKDMCKIQEEIAEWLGLKFDVESMSARANKLHRRLMDAKRKIIIFDDVWESLNLKDLGIPFKKCKILLTTQCKDICTRMTVQKVIEMKILTKEEAWSLFKEKAGNCMKLDPKISLLAEDVVPKCNGLPIALVVLAQSLRDQITCVWRDALSQLTGSNPTILPEIMENVYEALKQSYKCLDRENERELFLLCCLFPEDYNISVEQLSQYRMGLQIHDGITSVEEARNTTGKLVEKLKNRFMLIDGHKELQVKRQELHVERQRLHVEMPGLHVKMHGFYRTLAIHIGLTEMHGFLKSLNKISIENSTDVKCNWMSVDISNERMEFPVGLRFPKLRLLMLLKSSSNEFSDISFQGTDVLNVLSFPSTSIGSLPPTLGLLKNLQTLCLFHCEVENISAIAELTNLKILSCYGCENIKALPAGIGGLKELRLLELYKCSQLQRIPFGVISSLVMLEELKIRRSFTYWETGKEMKNASLIELESHTKLTCLEIEIDNWNLAGQEICFSKSLDKYHIHIASKDYPIKERDYEKAIHLNLLSGTTVPQWIQKLVNNTEYLCLEGDGSNKLKEFRTVFPWLESLSLRRLNKLKEICDGTKGSSDSFSRLKELQVHQLPELTHLWKNPNPNVSLCNLKSVIITTCSNLRTLFSVSMARASLFQLEVLEIEDCDTMEQVFWNEITDDTNAFIEFPKLKYLRLENLPNLTAFCQGIQTNFPNLTNWKIRELPKLLDIFGWHHDISSFHFLCNLKDEGNNHKNNHEDDEDESDKTHLCQRKIKSEKKNKDVDNRNEEDRGNENDDNDEDEDEDKDEDTCLRPRKSKRMGGVQEEVSI